MLVFYSIVPKSFVSKVVLKPEKTESNEYVKAH